MNSILKACDSECASLEAEIVQMIRAHRIDHKKLILVEGDSDQFVFQKLYDKELFDVYGSRRFAGCLHFETLVGNINEYYMKDFIVIKDADFDHLNLKTYDSYPNLFLTDTHDLETLMLVDGVYEKLNLDFGIEDGKRIMSDAIREILNLSYLKWMNNIYNIKLNFKDSCRVGSCYSGKNEVSVTECLKRINECPKNDSKKIFCDHEVEQFKTDHPISDAEILQITNGHDMINASVIKFKRIYKKNISRKDIEGLIQDNFSIEDYRKTLLYSKILNWFDSCEKN